MKRLTKTKEERYGIEEEGWYRNCEPDVGDIDDVYERLAEYEDTGLTPEQVQELKERDIVKKMVKGEFYSQVCPVCGKPARWRFCANCGQRLRED